MTAWCNATQDSSPYLHAYIHAQRCIASPGKSRGIGINIPAHPANALTGAVATCIASTILQDYNEYFTCCENQQDIGATRFSLAVLNQERRSRRAPSFTQGFA